MIFDALSVAGSSLKAQQKAIDVVAHNIANVNTAGYSRQVADLGSAAPDKIGDLNFGRGVNLQNIHRVIDPAINQAQLNNGSQLSYWQTVNSGLVSVENVFGSLQSTGLSSSLDQFFTSWQQLANNPQDVAQKGNVRAKTDAIISNMNNMQQQLAGAQDTADASINQSITGANQLLDSIAALSQQINRQETAGAAGVGSANDLRDQRDLALQQLAKIVPVQQINTGDNSFLVQTLDGDLLVQDASVQHLARGTALPGAFANIVVAETGSVVRGVNRGGEIGALIEMRDNTLNGYLADLNSIAANLVFSVNQIHSNSAPAGGHTAISSAQTSNPALALDDPAQTAPFSGQIVSGSFKVHLYDATGAATPVGGTAIAVTAGTTTMSDIAASLNAIPGLTAAVDASGLLNLTAGAGGSFAFSDDNSNVLAAYEINSFFQGSDAASISTSSAIQANAGAINTGQVNSLTSVISTGDNQGATAVVALQDIAVSVDGSPLLSLHNRTASMATSYGTDVSVASQQEQYRSVEAESLANQRQAFSGVNVDEELVEMIKFQRGYEASAKIITTTNQMLDSLMGLIR